MHSFPLSLASLALITSFLGPHHTRVPKSEFEETRILTSYVGAALIDGDMRSIYCGAFHPQAL
jgi:hypothetical protein